MALKILSSCCQFFFNNKIEKSLVNISITVLVYHSYRTEALWYFSKYAWDDTDFAQKEVTRYQGGPGQATAYMLGQQKLVQLREYAKAQLKAKFNIQDFHYQILSQGSAPEGYLTKHVKKYVQCSLGKLKGPTCDVILKPPKRSSSQTVETKGPPKPPKIHYY